jgi:hypothetical protein
MAIVKPWNCASSNSFFVLFFSFDVGRSMFDVRRSSLVSYLINLAASAASGLADT